jgi:hypothetical protein
LRREQTESGEIVEKWGYHHGDTKLPFYDVPPSYIFLSFGAYISLQKFILLMKLHIEWRRRPITCLEGGGSREDTGSSQEDGLLSGAGGDMNFDGNNNQHGEGVIYRYNLLHVVMCIFPH